MIDFIKQLNNYDNLSLKELLELYKTIISYYQKEIYIEDNLSGCKSLITHQNELINIEQFIIMNRELYMNCPILRKIQVLINSYDIVIQDKFSKFSKIEKINIIKEYNLFDVYESICNLKSVGNINDLDIYKSIPNDKLCNSIRLISNLGLIDYDGENIKPFMKIKQ